MCGGSIPVEGIVYKSIWVRFFSLTYTFRTQSELVPERKVFIPCLIMLAALVGAAGKHGWSNPCQNRTHMKQRFSEKEPSVKI